MQYPRNTLGFMLKMSLKVLEVFCPDTQCSLFRHLYVFCELKKINKSQLNKI